MAITSETKSIDLELGQIVPSKTNPRRHFDEKQMAELTASVKEKGVLQPILVRPVDSNRYELVAGERRLRAAKAAGLKTIAAVSRELSDTEVIECQVIENQQRADVHPLEEAAGYHSLMRVGKYDAARIAAKIGLSVKYVYDRMKLLELTKDAQELFWSGKLQAGHAILLARLSPADQKRALDFEQGGVFEAEHGLYTDDEEEALDKLKPRERDLATIKPVTVKELQAWIDQNVRFHAEKAEPFLFPESTRSVKAAVEKREKVVHITHNHHVPPELKDKTRVFCTTSWERADGQHGSKVCKFSVLGVVVVGPERGQAFPVCMNKEKCKTHWADWVKARAARAKGGGRSQADKWQQEQQRREQREKQERERRDQARAAYAKALPKILAAVAEAVKKAPTRAKGLLAGILVKECFQGNTAKAETYVPRGTTADELIRHAAFLSIYKDAVDTFWAYESFPKKAKALGVDVAAILKAQEPKKGGAHAKDKGTKRKAA